MYRTATPDINIITKSIAIKTSDVPKSGCNSIISMGAKTITQEIKKRHASFLEFFVLSKNRARNMIVVNLANSEGCIPKDPIPSHARAPFTTRPNMQV
jgi:hypothetical protein